MKLPIILIPLLAVAVAGCGRSIVKESKETVIEKPVVAQESKEIIVERPVVSREVIIEQPTLTKEVIVERQVPALRTCAYGSTSYSHGSLSCQGGYQYRCSDGTWEGRSLSC